MRISRRGEGGENAPLFHPTDTVLAAIILVVMGGLLYVSSTFEEVSQLLSQNIGPGVFPQLVMATIILLTLAMPFEHHFISGGRQRLDSGRDQPIKASAWMTAGLLTVIVVLMPVFGALFTMFLACLLLPPLWGNFRFRIVIPFAIVFPIAVKLVFSDLLKVHFEPGLMAGLIG